MPKNINANQAGTVQSNNVNDPSVRVIRGKNQFPQSWQHPSSTQYGVVDIVGVAKCERGDVYPYKYVTDLNTHTMASPVKSEVNMYSAAFKVPMQAIYPRNWEIMFPHPNKGDDVPYDTRALLNLNKLSKSLITAVNLSSERQYCDAYVRSVFLLETIFSDGGIFSKLNMHFCGATFTVSDDSALVDNYICFDDFFDLYFVPKLREHFASLPSSGAVANHLSYYDPNGGVPDYTVTDDRKLYGLKSYNNSYYISFDRAIELLRTGDYILKESSDTKFYKISTTATLPVDLNIETIISYQLACSHFFNNPKIDFIYSAQLWRDNMESLYKAFVTDLSSFDWNGTTKLYDVFSSNRLNNLVSLDEYLDVTGGNIEYYIYPYGFWHNLFNFNRSLRYGDYFTGAHPEPIAPGDINAPVINGTVNALDMTRKLQLTRYLNKVNISGPRIDDYLVALFGGSLPQAPKDVPVRLSLERFSIGGFEVNNTGDAQLSDAEGDENITTTNLRLSDSKYMFEANIDEPCYIIVVQYFDAHRIYSRTLDRFAYHRTRYDDFIPDLQFIGDQEVKTSELDAINGNEELPFAYNLRYMEYKQRYSYASGAFIRRLKSWAFITDNTDGNPMTNHITPDYIRSSPTEFDRFYKSLRGYSLGTRYHFMTYNTNVAQPYRQMVYAPEILA